MVFIGRHLLPKTDADDFNVDEVEQEIEANETSKTKKIICGMIMLGVIITMATGFVPLEIAAVIGALLCVITGCLSERQAYDSIDWVTIFLFAGMIPLASAMNTSGAGKLIAEYTVAALGGNPSPYVITAVLFILAVVLTQFMSNTASKALLCPVGIALAAQVGASPRAVLMAILIASSLCFRKSCRYSAEYSRSRPGQVLLYGLRQVRHRSCCHLPRGIYCGNPRGMAFLPELRGVWQYD